MVPGSRGWCRGLVWLMLFSFGTTIEQYDELPPAEDIIYQDDKEIDTGPPLTGRRLPAPLVGVSDAMLYRLLNDLRRQRAAPSRPLYRSNAIPTIDDLAPQVSVSKRFSNGSLQIPARVEPARLHLKWKTKKGKAIGSQMVCYFKLCAFRSPA